MMEEINKNYPNFLLLFISISQSITERKHDTWLLYVNIGMNPGPSQSQWLIDGVWLLNDASRRLNKYIGRKKPGSQNTGMSTNDIELKYVGVWRQFVAYIGFFL